MNKTKRIAALPAVLLGGCLALFGGCSPKKFSFKYEDKIYCSWIYDSVRRGWVTDKEAIKSFTDMLNACEKEKISDKKEKELTAPPVKDYYIVIGSEEFMLNENGCYISYLWSADGGIEKKDAFLLNGFDADVFNAFVDKRCEGGSPQS